ncbi:MAG TPA: hypothetical protein VD971_01785 [Phycisphaerales bacterium]|nr:hypothetical protein [Phycisphaerales bacterium]
MHVHEESRHERHEPAMKRLAWLCVAAVVGALTFVGVEAGVEHVGSVHSPQRLSGMWVTKDGTSAVTIGGSSWLCHVADEGLELVPRLVDERGTASGDVLCQAGGQRVGSFMVGPHAQNPNELALEVRREGHVAEPAIVLRRPR